MTLNDLLNDEAFAQELTKAADLAEAVEIIRAKGVEITEEELIKAIPETDSELDENALDSVAGGVISIIGGPVLIQEWLRKTVRKWVQGRIRK